MKSKTTSITISPEHLDTIITDIKGLLESNNDFVAFIILVIGIEFLGSFKDTENFSQERMSEIRFKNGLKYFNKNWYKTNNKLLYADLRCPLIHQYRPGDKFYLTSMQITNASQKDHLNERDGKIILVLECFFEEFEKAVHKLKKDIKNVKVTKREEEYFIIKDIPKKHSGIISGKGVSIIYDGNKSQTDDFTTVSGNTTFNNAETGN